MADHEKTYTPDKEGYEQSLEDLEAIEPAPKPSYSKFIVVLLFITIIAYTVTQLVFMWNGKQLNDVQTICFYSCMGFEFGSLAFIKGRKLRYSPGNAANKQMPHVEPVEEEEEEEEEEKEVSDD